MKFLAAAGLVAIAIWAAIAFALHSVERETLARAGIVGRNLARSLAEHQASRLRTFDLALLHLRAEWNDDPRHFAEHVARQQQYLNHEPAPQIVVIAADGIVAYSSLPGTQGMDLSDRPYFRSYKEHATDEFRSSAPLLSRLSGQWRIIYTCPLYDSQQRFAGVVALSVPPPALERVYNDIELGAGGVIALVRSDGQILAHSLDLERAATVSLATEPGLGANDPPAGEYRAVGKVDGVERLFDYQKVPGFPCTVFVGQSVDTVLAPYRVQRTTYLVSGALVTGLLLALAMLLASRRIGKELADRSRAQLAAIVQGSNDAIAGLDLYCKIVSWNAGAEHLYGYTEAEALAQPISITIPPDRLAEFTALPPRILRGEQVEHFETVRVARDGRRFDVLLCVSAIENADGAIVGISVIAQDISLRKRAEEALRESLERWEFAIEGTGAGVLDWDVLTGEMQFSDRWLEMAGYARDELAPRLESLTALVHPEDLPIAMADIQEVLQGRKAVHAVEHRLKHKSGHWIWVQARSIVSARNDRGEPLRMIGTHIDITARKRAEEALQESEELYRTLIERSPEPIAVHRDGKYTYFNPAANRLLGATPENNLLGKPILELIHPDYRQFVQERVSDLARGGETLPMAEVKFVKLDGTAIDVESRGTAIVIDGVPTTFVTWRDITERRRAKEALQASESWFRSIFENANTAIAATDRMGRVTQFNSAFVAMLGYDAEALKKMKFSDFTHPDDLELEIVYFNEILAGRLDHYRMTKRYIASDGRMVWVDLSAAAIRDAQGEVTNFVAVIVDITERRQAEAELRVAAVAFESQESMLITDANNVILRVNRAFTATSGYTAEEAIGQTPRLFKSGRHHADFYRAMWESIHRTGGWQGEIWDRRKNGEVYPKWLTISAVKDDRGAVTHFVAAYFEITERKQAEAAQAALEAQLRESQKMEAIGTLAGGIAHDFNNIIATILGNAELARLDASANTAILQSLDEIRKAASRARDLVQQILSFSRRQPTEFKVIEIAPLVEESVRLLRSTLPARLLLEWHCEPGMPRVRADATQIEQVLINLATNALQSMPDRPGHIEIRVDTVMLDAALAEAHPALRALHAKHPGRTVRVSVNDDGPGMDAATMERIFEPFFTTRTATGGTGLGLSVVHGIVKAHGGAIEVVSRPGKGTRFGIYLPATDAEAGAPEANAETAAPVLGGGQHVLYLDDDEALVLLVQRLLERRGLRVSGYVRQEEALSALRADPEAFDLVVSDYNMPGTSGLDVAREVRAIRGDIPVAITSGFIDEALRAQAAGAGVRELIFKADVVEDLCDAVQRLLPKRH